MTSIQDVKNLRSLIYALLMICRRLLGEIVSVRLSKYKFELFSKASGLAANFAKTQVYFGGVANDVKE